jgi:hypothetical protein
MSQGTAPAIEDDMIFGANGEMMMEYVIPERRDDRANLM